MAAPIRIVIVVVVLDLTNVVSNAMIVVTLVSTRTHAAAAAGKLLDSEGHEHHE